MPALIMKNFRLVTAEILYHLPDHPALLQTYVWQDHDITPHLPALKDFLSFWQRSLDGKLHSVSVFAGKSVRITRYTYTDNLFTLQ